MRPAPDTTLAEGRYRLTQRLGAGGMASVWLGVDERLGRPVAVKIVADTLAGDEQWVRRFNREARAAAALSHRGVVPVFDYGVEDGRPYLIMEYIPGGTLAARLSGDGDGVPDAEAVAGDLLEALGAVHAAGILHRDIKPANLLLDEHGYVRLTDFGIAQPEDASALTQPGLVVGTLRYLAPEVAAGGPASIQSDLYSVGVVLRQLSGRRASPRLARLVAALTAEAPSDRPVSAAAALQLLGAAPPRPKPAPSRPGTASPRADTAPTRILAGETTATRHQAEGLRRHGINPRLAYGGLAGIVVLVLIVVVVALSSGGSSPSAGTAASPAPATAPLARQFQGLEAIVKSAARR
ncbi:MAG: serine/threonine-protein kinase [Solirubrobacteraceae bacterium]